MSNSSNYLGHRNLVSVRRRYSPEPLWEARFGVRGSQIGFDTDNRAQQQLRAQLALYTLNSAQTPPRELLEANHNRDRYWHDRNGLMTYSFVLSPRFDELAIFSAIPGHMVKTVYFFPGTRFETVDLKHDALILRHLPTGSALSLRYFPSHHPKMRQKCPKHTLLGTADWLRQDIGLVDEERLALDCLPEMSEDAERLLAALVSRLHLHSRTEKWAVGALIDDPIRRPRQPTSPWKFTYCWGHDRDWVVRWGGGLHAVPAADVARALTHPLVGLATAVAVRQEQDRAEVHFGDARLRLERHFPSGRAPFGGAR
ncbi:hypothetical protein ACFXHA_33295 [Nocardia sp. NPDC059240]|uniref:hypothetical protein n=1 Tax=Nocardia sp. NPDC059240 TaxID=3346786 RepID=UPI003687A912